jgi:hypothetical protein
MAYEVNLVNPKKRRKVAKKSSKRRKRARRDQSTQTAATPARRRRRHNPGAKKGRRRRRHNPGMGGMMGTITAQLKGAMPRMLGQLAVGAVAKYAERFGGKSEGGAFSPTYGEPWTMQQYLAAGAVALLAPRFLGKYLNASSFQTGAIDLIMGKLLYTEAIARFPAAQKFLGEAGEYDVQYQGGQGYVNVDGNYEAMQGLVERTALGDLVETPAYGSLVDAGPMGEADYRLDRASDPYGY